MKCSLVSAFVVPLLLIVALGNAGIQESPSAAAIESSHVSIRKDAIPLPQALAEVTRQTGNKVSDLRPRYGQDVSSPPLRLALERVPFWQALDAIAHQAGTSVYLHAPEARVGLLGKPSSSPLPVAYSGPFRAVITEVATHLDLQNKGRSHLRLTLEIAWEPRLEPILLNTTVDSVKLAGSDGRPLTVNPGKGTIKLKGTGVLPLPLRLPLPPREQKNLAWIEGRFSALVPPEMIQFEFPSLKSGAHESKKKVTARLADVRREGEFWAVEIHYQYPPGAFELESHQTWAVEEAVQLRREGVTVKNAGQEVLEVEGGRLQVRYRFPDGEGKPDDWSLVCRVPAPPVLTQVDFVFKNVPLP